MMVRNKKIFLLSTLFFMTISVHHISKSCGGFFDTEQEIATNQKLSVVLFDFDGTIADSFESSIAVANQLAQEYNFAPLTKEQIESIRHVPLKDIMINHFKIPWYKVPMIVLRGKELISDQKYVDKLSPFDGIHDSLKSIANHKLTLGILTSSGEARVQQFINKHNFTCFKTVYADSSLFGKHHCLQRFLDNHGLSAQNVIYVGDEVRDMEAAHAVGMRCIAVGWGFNSIEALAEQKPLAVVKTPAELVDQIARLITS